MPCDDELPWPLPELLEEEEPDEPEEEDDELLDEDEELVGTVLQAVVASIRPRKKNCLIIFIKNFSYLFIIKHIAQADTGG